MGVYIDMELPKVCGDCLFYGLENAGNGMYWDYCRCKRQIVNDPDNSVDKDCPLVSVPPHGRLIDADALIDEVIAKYLEHERKCELIFSAAQIKQDICDLISDAPTIIPAEEGET